MNDILNKAMVLGLNRNWQAVNVRLGPMQHGGGRGDVLN
jgi:hypothetical protein